MVATSLLTAVQAEPVEDGPPPLIDLDGTLYIQFGLFLVMLLVLSRFLFKPYLKMRDQRSEGIEGARHKAEEMRSRAERLGVDYEAQLHRGKLKGAEVRASLRGEGAARERELLGTARTEIQAAVTTARAQVARQTEQARTQLAADAARLATQMTAKILGRELRLVIARLAILALILASPVLVHAEGQATESPEAGVHDEHEATGIVNWFSTDYGRTAKEPSHRHYPPPFGFALINFLVFAGILIKFAGPSVSKSLQTRHDNVRKQLDEASALRAEAEARLKDYEARIAGIDREVGQLLGTIRQDAEEEKARIIRAAEDQARRLKADAEHQIAVEIARARQDLRREVVDAAFAAAQALLQQRVTDSDQRRLADRYVADLEKASIRTGGRQ